MVVAEDGGDLQLPTDRLHVAGDDIDGGHFAALDLGDPAFARAGYTTRAVTLKTATAVK